MADRAHALRVADTACEILTVLEDRHADTPAIALAAILSATAALLAQQPFPELHIATIRRTIEGIREQHRERGDPETATWQGPWFNG